MDPTAEVVEEFGRTVEALRKEMKATKPDQEVLDRINTHLDDYEEKVNQPLVKMQQAAKIQADELKELTEKLEKAGVTGDEAKARIDALEIELATRGSGPDGEKDYRETDEYKAYEHWSRKGEGQLTEEHKAVLRTDSEVDGGFLVTGEMDSTITKKITEIDDIRSIARVQTVGSKTFEIPIRATIPVAKYEGEAELSEDSNSTYENTTMVPFAQTYTAGVTWDQLQDAAFDMNAQMMSDAAEAFAFGEGNGFVVGSGFKQPAGFVANSVLQAGARPTAASGVLDPEALILLTGDLKVGYQPVYVMNRRTLALIRTFRADAVSAGDSASAFLWQPGLNGPVSNTINGFPYILANSMPDVAAGAYAVAFGDFARGYTIIDRTGTSVVRDNLTQKRRRIVEFTFNRWNTGQVTLPEAIKLLQIQS